MNILLSLFEFTRSFSVGSLILRAVIWLIAVLILATGIDNGAQMSKIKADVGWFFLFVFSIGILSFMFFGFAPTF